MKKLVAIVIIAFACLSVIFAQGKREDPLLSLQQQATVHLGTKMKHGPLQSWAMEELRFRFTVCRNLRDFFSFRNDARTKIGARSITEVLRGVRYVIEDISLKEIHSPGDAEQKNVDKSPFAALKRAIGYEAEVVVFIPEKEALSLDLSYSSIALLPKKLAGRDRKLRSRTYERFLVTVSKEGEQAVVTSCAKDDSFDSEKYVLLKTKDRINVLVLKALSQKELKKMNADLNLGFSGKIGRSIRELSSIDGSQNSWKLRVFLNERGENTVPQPVTILLDYDWNKDEVKIQKYTKDVNEKIELEQRRNIADFVKKYLKSDSKTRGQMRTKGATSKLPEKGTFAFVMSFKDVTKLSDNMWKCEFFIRHSGNFGRPLKRGIYRTVRFRCKVRSNDRGQLEVVEDSYSSVLR